MSAFITELPYMVSMRGVVDGGGDVNNHGDEMRRRTW